MKNRFRSLYAYSLGVFIILMSFAINSETLSRDILKGLSLSGTIIITLIYLYNTRHCSITQKVMEGLLLAVSFMFMFVIGMSWIAEMVYTIALIGMTLGMQYLNRELTMNLNKVLLLVTLGLGFGMLSLHLSMISLFSFLLYLLVLYYYDRSRRKLDYILSTFVNLVFYISVVF